MTKNLFERLRKLHAPKKEKPAVRPTQFRGFEKLHAILNKGLKRKNDAA